MKADDFQMKIKLAAFLLAAMLLNGCAGQQQDFVQLMEEAESIPTATVPENGNPNDVTCKGSYTNRGNADTIVTASGTWALTNEQLSVWYWAEVAQYQQENHEIAPDFEILAAILSEAGPVFLAHGPGADSAQPGRTFAHRGGLSA